MVSKETHWSWTIFIEFQPLLVSDGLYPNVFVGYGNLYDPNNTKEEYLNDIQRINYMSGHLGNLGASIR